MRATRGAHGDFRADLVDMCDGILVSVREDGDLMDPFEEGHSSATEPAVVDPAIVAPPGAPVVVDSLVQGLVGVSLGTEALDLPGGSGADARTQSLHNHRT